MPINFFSFPSEIRNKIYGEALVLSELVALWGMQIIPRNTVISASRSAYPNPFSPLAFLQRRL
jgi:hypothetical protein